MCEQRPIQYDFHAGIRAIRYYNSHHKCNIADHAYAKFWEANKVYDGSFANDK